jgi:hypothetical protein
MVIVVEEGSTLQQVLARLRAIGRRGDSAVLAEMATLKKSVSGLPVNLWLDNSRAYVQGRHAKRIKFQGDPGNSINSGNLFPMTISPTTRRFPKNCSQKLNFQRKMLLQSRCLFKATQTF